jgi:hypothetical protein
MWRSPETLPLDPAEMARVHQLHVYLGAVGCTARVDDLYDRCACGRGKYRWLPHCEVCHRKNRGERSAA